MISNLNIPVFTVKNIVINKRPIVYVLHDGDGEWQFLGSDECSSADIMMVSMKQILELDNSIEQILWLPSGMEAFRNNTNAEWETRACKHDSE